MSPLDPNFVEVTNWIGSSELLRMQILHDNVREIEKRDLAVLQESFPVPGYPFQVNIIMKDGTVYTFAQKHYYQMEKVYDLLRQKIFGGI